MTDTKDKLNAVLQKLKGQGRELTDAELDGTTGGVSIDDTIAGFGYPQSARQADGPSTVALHGYPQNVRVADGPGAIARFGYPQGV